MYGLIVLFIVHPLIFTCSSPDEKLYTPRISIPDLFGGVSVIEVSYYKKASTDIIMLPFLDQTKH